MDRQELQDELDGLKASTAARFGEEVAKRTALAHRQQINSVRDAAVVESSLGYGDLAPDFAAWDQHDRAVRLSTLLTAGPVVISFFRGGWCSYCRTEIQAYQSHTRDFQKAGVGVLAISPESPAYIRRTADECGATFPILSDAGNMIGRSFGIVFAFSEELIDNYLSMSRSLVDINGDNKWELPIPATYLVAQSGVIENAFVDPDYSKRRDPASVLALVEEAKSTA